MKEIEKKKENEMKVKLTNKQKNFLKRGASPFL